MWSASAVCAKCRMCGIANGVNCQKCRRSNGWMRNRHSQRNMRANSFTEISIVLIFCCFFDLISLYSFCCVGRFFGSHIIHKVHSAFNSFRLVDNNYLPRHILSPLCPVCVFSSVFSHSIRTSVYAVSNMKYDTVFSAVERQGRLLFDAHTQNGANANCLCMRREYETALSQRLRPSFFFLLSISDSFFGEFPEWFALYFNLFTYFPVCLRVCGCCGAYIRPD